VNAPDEFDIVIVGSGATGGWAAKELTEKGHRVCLLEAGPRLEPAELDRADDEAEHPSKRRPIQSRNRVFTARNGHLYIDDLDHPYATPPDAPYHWIRSRLLGGRTLLWSGICLRMSDLEFNGADSVAGRVRWPISERDLAPHYDRVETFLGVRGVRDGLPYLPDGQFLPPAKPWEPFMHDYARALNDRWPDRRMIAPRGIERAESSPRAENGYPRCSSVGSTLAAAERTGRLAVHPDAVVTRLNLDASTGRINRIHYKNRTDGALQVVEARVVILAASTIESIRILLNSANERHPHGLANSSGTLGRYLMDHCAGPTLRATGPVLTGTPAIFYVPGLRHRAAPSGPSFAGGYAIEGTFTPLADRGGLIFGMMGEVLPRAENTVRLASDRVDRWGVPLPQIELRYSDEERAMARNALAAMTEIAAALGHQILAKNETLLPPGTRSHELGGARMGNHSRTSVLNRFNQSWDIPNLFVIDGACFPTAGYQNPTLTMVALADRACAFITNERAKGHL
jgi:choline dehydrogenase-like flavoprotein